MNDVCFTGTRDGMTRKQKHELRMKLIEVKSPHIIFRHGDCRGADYEAAEIAESLGYIIIAHPGINRQGKSPTRGYFPANTLTLDPKLYWVRDRDIVVASDLLIGAPKSQIRTQGSGTWLTIGIAERLEKPHIILLP